MVNQQLFNSTRHLAYELARQLERHQTKIVFAESCTAGLVSAVLAQVPGISRWLCGSSVTYQDSVKHHWLQIDEELIAEQSAVSMAVTQKMAEQVLKYTPSANFSIAVTGHLEQSASDEGCIAWVGLGYREDNSIVVCQPVQFRLTARCRLDRQWQAARDALNMAVAHLRCPPSEQKSSVDWYKICSEPVDFHWDPWI